MERFTRCDEDIESTIEKYADLIYRTSFLMLRNKADVDDIIQETFYKYMITDVDFTDENHRRAWLLRVSQNKCKDLLRSHKLRAYVPYDEIREKLYHEDDLEKSDIEDILTVANLNYKNKSVIVLHYMEEYSVDEVAEILGISANAVKKRLQRAREKTKEAYEKNIGGECRYES